MVNKYLYFLMIVYFSCSSPKSYYGYVCNQQNKPLQNVKVISFPKNNYTYTEAKGYFILAKTREISASLIFIKEGYLIDTIPSEAGNEFLYKNFIGDTFSLKSKK